MSKKLVALFLIVILAFIALAVDITYINATRGERYQRQILSQTQQSYDSRIIPYQRGDITDRNGTILATSEKIYNVILDCKVVNTVLRVNGRETRPYVEPTVAALVKLFDLEESDIRRRLEDEETKDSQYQVLIRQLSINDKKAFEDYVSEYENTDSRDLTEREQAIKKERAKIRGVWFEDDYLRVYPMNSLACDLIGFTYTGNTADWGIEGYYSSVLNGVNGRQFGYYNTDADLEQTIIEAVPGNNVVSTIDVNVQQIIREALERFNIRMSDGDPEKTEEEIARTKGAANAAVVVLDPNSGEILGMDSTDWYDLNDPRDLSLFYTEEEIAAMDEAAMMDALNGIWRNYCVSDTYEPGSTSKPMTIASGFACNAISEDDTFECDGKENIADREIKCAVYPGEHGTETVKEALMNSCNDALMQIARRIGAADLLRYQSIFGFGSRTGIDLPGEAYGIVYSEENMGPTQLATTSFGQGFNVTMIQQISAFASVINGGYYYQPHVVKTITDSTGAVVESKEPTVLRQTVSGEISRKLREYLAAAVEKGTGQGAKVEGYTMGGKTGTAQKLPRGNGRYLVSFIGFAPAEHPEVVVYAVVDEPHTDAQANSAYAQEIAKEIFTELLPYLNVFPDENKEQAGNASERGVEDENVPAPPDGGEDDGSGDNLLSDGITNDEADLASE